MAQLPVALLDSRSNMVMFWNALESPMRLEAGQALGRVTMSRGGYMVELSMELDWADMTRLGHATCDIPGLKVLSFARPSTSKPPMGAALNAELDALAMLVVETEHSWVNKPRSISEEQVMRIAQGAVPMMKAELFPPEIDDEDIPYPPQHTLGNNLQYILVCNTKLSEAMKAQLLGVLTAHSGVFSVNGELGKVVTAEAGIDTIDG